MERHVLLGNVGKDLDLWTLRRTVPCGDLMEKTERNPNDPSKIIVIAKSEENAKEIVRVLDQAEVCGRILSAVLAFAPKKGPSPFDGGKLEVTVKKEKIDVDDPDMSLVPMPIHDLSGAGNRTEEMESETGSIHSDKTLTERTHQEETRRRHGKRKSSRQKLCRFCSSTDHNTHKCAEYAEYYHVSWTDKEDKGKGQKWPKVGIIIIKGMHAGPVIKYFEDRHFSGERLAGKYLRILFAFLVNKTACLRCGAGGHYRNNDMCQYLGGFDGIPEVTTRMLDERDTFVRRVSGIRRRLTLGKLQEHCHLAVQEFAKSLKKPEIDWTGLSEEPRQKVPAMISTPEPKRLKTTIIGEEATKPKWTIQRQFDRMEPNTNGQILYGHHTQSQSPSDFQAQIMKNFGNAFAFGPTPQYPNNIYQNLNASGLGHWASK